MEDSSDNNISSPVISKTSTSKINLDGQTGSDDCNNLDSKHSNLILIVEDKPFVIEQKIYIKSPVLASYARENQAEEECKYVLPVSTKIEYLQFLIEFLQTGILSEKIDLKDLNISHQLLRLSDFLQLEKFKMTLITEKIVPNINNQNCWLFLSEACEKLKSFSQLPDPWLLLLNKSINCLATSFLSSAVKNKDALFGLNKKVFDQIIQRSLRFEKLENRVKIIKFIIEAKEGQNCIEYLREHKDKILQQYTSESREQTATSWCLRKLLQSKNYESEPFWNGGFKWKLITKVRDSYRDSKKKVDVYLKYVRNSALEIQEKTIKSPLKSTTLLDLYDSISRFENKNSCALEPIENSNPSYEGILSFSCRTTINEKDISEEVQIHDLNTTLLSRTHLQTLTLDLDTITNEAQLAISLNFDFIHSALLEYILASIQTCSKVEKIDALSSDDLLVILKSLPKESQAQGSGLTLAIRWLNNVTSTLPDNFVQEMIDCFDLRLVYIDQLITITLKYTQLLSEYPKISEQLENQIARKRVLLRSTMSPRNTKSSNPKTASSMKSPFHNETATSTSTTKITERYRNAQPRADKSSKPTTPKPNRIAKLNLNLIGGCSGKPSTTKLDSTCRKSGKSKNLVIERKLFETLTTKDSKANDEAPIFDIKAHKRQDSEVTVAHEDIRGIDESDYYKIPVSDYSASYYYRTPKNGSRAASVGLMSSPSKTRTVANQIFHQQVNSSPLSQQKFSAQNNDTSQLETVNLITSDLKFAYEKRVSSNFVSGLSMKKSNSNKVTGDSNQSQSILNTELTQGNPYYELSTLKKKGKDSSRKQALTPRTPKKSQTFSKPKKPPTLVQITLEPNENNQKLHLVKNEIKSKKPSRDFNKNTRTRSKRINSVPSNQDLISAISSNLQTFRDDSTSGMSLTNHSSIVGNDTIERGQPIKLIPVSAVSQKIHARRHPSFNKTKGFHSCGLTPMTMNKNKDSKSYLSDSYFTKKGDNYSRITDNCMNSSPQKANDYIYLKENETIEIIKQAAILYENTTNDEDVSLKATQKNEERFTKVQKNLQDLAVYSHFYAHANFSKPFKAKYLSQKLMEQMEKKKLELIKKLDLKNFQYEKTTVFN